MTSEEIQEREDWLERCRDCKGKGVVPTNLGQLAICGSCGGECFVPHYEDEECRRLCGTCNMLHDPEDCPYR